MTFEPELGQTSFGSPWSAYKCPKYVVGLVRELFREVSRVHGNVYQNYWDSDYPTDPDIPGITINPYYWDKCTCGFNEKEMAWEDSHSHSYSRGWSGSALHCTCDYKKDSQEWYSTNQHSLDCRVIQPNLKFEDVEIRWYKHLGRSTSTNKEMSPEEWVSWFNRYLEHLRNFEKEKLPFLYRS